MTPAQLKEHVASGSDSHFFDRKTMRFFGDTMSNYGVRSVTVKLPHRRPRMTPERLTDTIIAAAAVCAAGAILWAVFTVAFLI